MPNVLDLTASDFAILAIVGLSGLCVAVALYKSVFLWIVALRKRRLPENSPLDNLCIDVAELPNDGPPEGRSQLTCYGVPIRIAVVVVAPAGRDGKIPEAEQIPAIIDGIVPGLVEFIARDHPRIDRWPPQLSVRGFGRAFFSCIRLPHDRGKGTPWCSIVGRVESAEQMVLVGMVLCASNPNSLGEMEVEKPWQWLDILRIRD